MGKSKPAEELAWTGERLVAGCRRPLVYEHLHRYALAVALAKGKRVLDIACGEGYGANLLAGVASKVVGVDLDRATIAHAKAKYRRPNLRFLQGACTKIPCHDQSIDLVASFETIEHISEHDLFLAEIKRVLAPGGILVISSPHKTEYRKVSEAPNPFHTAELDHDEFVRLVTKTFKHCVAAKQRLVVGSWIAPDAPSAKVAAATFSGWLDGIDIERGVSHGLYSIAVCSDRTLPVFELGMFENFRASADTWNLLDTYDTPAQLSARLLELSRVSDEKIQQVLHLRHEFEEKTRHVGLLQDEVKEKAKHIGLLQGDLEERSQQVAHFQEHAEEKTQRAAQLQRDLEERSGQVARFQRENEQQAQLLERLRDQLETASDRLTRARDELLDARWEALTLRGLLVRKNDSPNTPSARLLELEGRLAATASERDELRKIATSLQNELEQERLEHDELRKAITKELQSERKQMDRLRQSISHKLILPFGRSQRKLQQLTASRRADD